MAVSVETKKKYAWSVGLRALLMLLGGLYALVFPAQALTVLVIAGGALLIVDGALGLWGLTFGGARTGNFWFDIVRNALALLLGVLIILSPILATLLTATFLVYLFAFQAIVVGVMEIVIILREREHYAKIWPVLLSGVAYVIFGVLLLLMPVLSALVLVTLAGILMVIFSVALFALAWRMSKTAA